MEHMASTDEAIANVASLYNQQLANVTKITVQQDATINGPTTIKGPLSALGGTINTFPGRLDNSTGAGFVTNPDGTFHIAGPQILYLLNKGGIVIGKHWGGNGNLTIQGDTNIGSNLSVQGTSAFTNMISIKGVDPRDWGIGAIFYDHNNEHHKDGFYGLPFPFPPGKYRFNDDGGSGNDRFDAVTINPLFRVKISGGWGEGEEWKVTWENPTTSPIYKRLDQEGARVNSASNIIVEKM